MVASGHSRTGVEGIDAPATPPNSTEKSQAAASTPGQFPQAVVPGLLRPTRLEYSRFAVWSYTRPSGHPKSGGFLRGTSAPVVEWAFALVDESSRPLLVYDVAFGTHGGFISAEEAVAAARKADWERAAKAEGK